MSREDELRLRYCPPLEESLFFALASDFDLDDAEQRQQLDQILTGIKAQAIVEQELELAVPLSVDKNVGTDGDHLGAGTLSTHLDANGTTTGDTIGSITTGLSDLYTSSRQTESSDAGDTGLPPGLERATSNEKETWLKTLFPSIESIQISETLAKCGDDIQRSVDELLNLSFFHDDLDAHYVAPVVPKGIDAFSERTKKKSKSKKNRRKHDHDNAYISDESLPSGAMTPSNIWRSAAEDVEFIVSRTSLSATTVHSIYHQNNANLAATIRALVAKEVASHQQKIRGDDVLAIQVSELKLELESFADNDIYGALLLAQMIPSAAKDLLEAMIARPAKTIGGRIVPQYTPVNLSEDEKPKKMAPVSTVAIDPGLLAGQAGAHSVAANQAFSQAQSSYRRGKSDRLMSGAAAYYAQVGHEERMRQKALMSSAADAHVSLQSSANTLDLHGVTVEHAVRIARSKVEAWWDGLGDRKYVVGGIGLGYKIIVGLGTHSAQGIGRIGPAVSKMLIREGWKVNVQRGEILVEGKARR